MSPRQSSVQTTEGDGMAMRHHSLLIMQRVCEIWNADNAHFNVPWKWEVVKDDHPKWPYTVRREQA